ncbi:Methyltransferase domain-containing protein [Hydrobacter penzbergensis]|jgi:SAM-dependent methyltransferase|uniref:Methyltransferase domain-containing protein n=1 Tax=Hydrobacter penzbergensis TaxID=1235997 RepID=A0A8X8LCP2_9BACT|nr:class I SAM-dependent methyltransferase [Hydrobacter penzbergensis]MBN8720627.1 methyltransferase domain-containing protein [Sediminibacterium magnilacihabitans]PQV59547.1 methyltransferase family protein [Sediminibacterium magnilacihabitans]SDX52939.1 Methyltransferase domain-containing protein [Hydrobacter penzbergensis]
MPDKSWYKDWFNSHYYHLLYQHRDEEEAMAFIQTLISYLQPPCGCRMLDVACGKGRHSKALADMGFDVTGIDLSEASIAEAKADEDDNLHFYQHDMRLPFWINYFDYAFNFFTSFGYFRTRREHDNAIRTIAQSLQHQGLFVIDYLNVHYVEDRLQQSFITTIEDVAFHITKWQDEEHFFKQIQITDDSNKTPKHLYTERVAKFSLGDFTDMLSYQNMQVQEVFGDYQLGHYDVRTSPRMIIVAKKK